MDNLNIFISEDDIPDEYRRTTESNNPQCGEENDADDLKRELNHLEQKLHSIKREIHLIKDEIVLLKTLYPTNYQSSTE